MLAEYAFNTGVNNNDTVVLPANMDPSLVAMLIHCVQTHNRYIVAIDIPGDEPYYDLYECYLSVDGWWRGNSLVYHTNSYCNPRQINMYAWDHTKLVIPNTKARCKKSERGWVATDFEVDKLYRGYSVHYNLWLENNPKVTRGTSHGKRTQSKSDAALWGASSFV